jgi:hypothetical protein
MATIFFASCGRGGPERRTSNRPRHIGKSIKYESLAKIKYQKLAFLGVRLGVSKGAASHLPCGRATPETAARPFHGGPAHRQMYQIPLGHPKPHVEGKTKFFLKLANYCFCFYPRLERSQQISTPKEKSNAFHFCLVMK